MKVSIITATYNSGRTLRDTMKSVLSQQYADLEHIIVDGGSKDNTVDIIREMEPKYGNRLKWISERDRGIYDAMNKGIAMATGDIIGILNSDDFYTSPAIVAAVAHELSIHPDVDAVYGDIHFVDDDNLDKCVRYYSSRWFHRALMPMGYQPAHPSFYCRQSVYRQFGSFDLDFKIAADFEHMFRLIYVNEIKTMYLPIDFVTMRTGGASTAGLSSHKRIIEDHYRTYRKHGVKAGYALDFLRYPLKIGEVVISKMIPSYRK